MLNLQFTFFASTSNYGINSNSHCKSVLPTFTERKNPFLTRRKQKKKKTENIQKKSEKNRLLNDFFIYKISIKFFSLCESDPDLYDLFVTIIV